MKLQDKLKTLPRSPGVYFHKDKSGQIIYVGKAAVLKNRVRQYFQNMHDKDAKTKALVAEIADTDWIETESEIDALFLEAEMVKRYMPRYNILLRDDKSLTYVRIDMNNDWPYVSFTRNPADDGAQYFGPYYNSFAIKKALRYLRRIFPYYTIKPSFARSAPASKNLTKVGGLRTGVERLDLDAHLGLSPVNMTGAEYKVTLRKLISYIKGGRKEIISQLERDMAKAAKLQNFELAASIRNKLNNLRELQRQIMFGDKEFLDISKDVALRDLTDLLNLKKIPVRIEGFDISHMSGTNVVASMVVFRNGVSDRSQYRKFKSGSQQNDDYKNMNEVITRRLSEKNLTSWGVPDLVLIDGGKGQLDAAIEARDKCGQTSIPFIGLAKKEEQIIIKNNSSFAGPDVRSTPNPRNRVTNSLGLGVAPPHATRESIIPINKTKIVELKGDTINTEDYILINLPNSSHIIKLLQRIRDESHRFAVSYHTVLKRAGQTTSILDGIIGIGPKTRAKLIRKFGSLRGLKGASEQQIADVVGAKKARQIINNL